MRKLLVFLAGMMLFLQQVRAQESISIIAPQSSGGTNNCLLKGALVGQDVWVKNTGSVPISSWIAVQLAVGGDSTQTFITDTIPAGLPSGDSALVNLPYVVPNWSPYYLSIWAGNSTVFDSTFVQECADIDDLGISFVSPQPNGGQMDAVGTVQQVVVKVENFSTTKTYDSLIVNWTINGSVQVSINVSMPSGLSPLSTDTFTIGNYVVPVGTTEIKVWIDSQDNYPQNDTIVQVRQAYIPPVITQITAVICENDFYLFGGDTLTTTGIYVDSLSVLSGDSVWILTLTVIPTITPVYAVICQGKTYNFGGQTLSTNGIYYDTLQNHLGCDSIVELNLFVDSSAYCDAIMGHVVHQQTFTYCSGIVLLYLIDSGQYILKDTATIGVNGFYVFTNVADGDYVVKAIPDSSENALPTYHTSTTFWSSADIVTVGNGYFVDSVFIFVIPQSPRNGNSLINGYVGGDGHKSISQKRVFYPAEDVDVYLQIEQSDTWTTISQTLTNADGYFEFKNVSVGRYRVMLDVPGVEMIDIQEVNIVNDGDTVQIEEYEITKVGIFKSSVGVVNHELETTNYAIYPNPTTGQITVKSDKVYQVENIVIYDVVGQVVGAYRIRPENTETIIDISHLSAGLYFLKIDGKTFKVVKE